MFIRQASRTQGMASSDKRLRPASRLREFLAPQLEYPLVETQKHYLDLLINRHICSLAPFCASSLGRMGPRNTL